MAGQRAATAAPGAAQGGDQQAAAEASDPSPLPLKKYNVLSIWEQFRLVHFTQ